MHYIHENAERISGILQKMGHVVQRVSHSTNRHGGHSTYLEMGSFRFRISDHDCNTDFRVAEFYLHHEADESALIEWFSIYQRNTQARIEKRQLDDAARNELENPFKTRFLATKKEHERDEIIMEFDRFCAKKTAHKKLFYTHDKAARRTLRARWLAA